MHYIFFLSIYPLTPIDVTKEINLLQNGEIIRVHKLIAKPNIVLLNAEWHALDNLSGYYLL